MILCLRKKNTKIQELWAKMLNFSVLFFSNTKLLIFGNFYFSKKSLNSFVYKDELITLFEYGQKWVQKISDWDFLVQWNIKNNNALQALCILKYLDRKEDFNYLKDESILKYKALNLPIDELENIEW